METRTIQTLLLAKFDKWRNSISDPAVKSMVKNNTIITGGCIASMLLGESVNDFDLYFTNKETTKAVAEYYTNKFNEVTGCKGKVIDGEFFNASLFQGGVSLNMTPDRIKIIFQSSGVASTSDTLRDEEGNLIVAKEDPAQPAKPKYRPVFLSCNAITLSDKIQIVIRFYGNAEEIHGHYDYIHCTNYWESKNGGNLVLNQKALESLLTKELTYTGSLYPIASLIRTRKFIKRGWTINIGQYLKMAYQISKLDLDNVAVLEDQLTGVDAAYFTTLINALVAYVEAAKKENIEFTLTYGYLVTIIDRIFG